MDNDIKYHFLKSALTTKNTLMSNDDFLNWIEEKRKQPIIKSHLYHFPIWKIGDLTPLQAI